MLKSLAIPYEWKIINKFLEEVNCRNEISSVEFTIKDFNDTLKLEDTLEEFGLNSSDLVGKTLKFNTIYLFEFQKYLIYEPTFHFNKYRLITLRDELYHNYSPFDIQKHRNYCRTKEQEALKSGLKSEIWTLKEGEELLGTSEEAGYFGGKGSSGWKYIAIANYLLDIYSYDKNFAFHRFSPFDTLMVDGKLIQFQTLLLSSEPKHKEAIQKYMVRKLDIPVEKLESDVFISNKP
jgi:hypothetical protein